MEVREAFIVKAFRYYALESSISVTALCLSEARLSQPRLLLGHGISLMALQVNSPAGFNLEAGVFDVRDCNLQMGQG